MNIIKDYACACENDIGTVLGTFSRKKFARGTKKFRRHAAGLKGKNHGFLFPGNKKRAQKTKMSTS